MSSTREVSSDPPSYPRDGTYGDLLTWHLRVWGTRPEQGKARGAEWDPKKFAAIIYEGSKSDLLSWDASLKNWMSGSHKPGSKARRAKIEQALFGANPDLMLWRDDLRAAFSRKLVAGSGAQLPLISPKQSLYAFEVTSEIATDLAELLSIARAGGVFKAAAEQGISEVAIRSVVEKLGGMNVARDNLVSWLDRWVDAVCSERDPARRGEFAIHEAKVQADERLISGNLSNVSDPFMLLLRDQQISSLRVQSSILENAIRYDLLAFDVEKAFSKTMMLTPIYKELNGLSASRYLSETANGYLKDKDFYLADNYTIELGMLLYREALERLDGQDAKQFRIVTEINLGLALWTLGSRKYNRSYLEEAYSVFVRAVDLSLEINAVSLLGESLDGLGIVLIKMHGLSREQSYLDEAIATLKLALKFHRRKKSPLYWAVSLINLTAAIIDFGILYQDQRQFRWAIRALNLVATVTKRGGDTAGWMKAQHNLGFALSKLADFADDPSLLRQSVFHLWQATRYQRLKYPLRWAESQYLLARELHVLGCSDGREIHFRRAQFCLSRSLEIFERYNLTINCARLQLLLGLNLIQLSRYENRADFLFDAKKALERAFDGFNNKDFEGARAYTGHLLKSIACDIEK